MIIPRQKIRLNNLEWYGTLLMVVYVSRQLLCGAWFVATGNVSHT